jgi:predicted TIM-barrel fold metal-dependent hydrolase
LKWSHARRAFRRHADARYAERQGLVDAVRAFGSRRVMWASDVSFEESNASWGELLFSVKDEPELSEEDRTWVLGRTARRVYKWEN